MLRAAAGAALAAIVLIAAPAVTAHEAHHPGHGPALPPADNAAKAPARRALPMDEAAQRAWFTDLPLVNQEGETVRFFTDVLKDRVVLVSFIYTNCTDVCPLLPGNLVEVERLLGERAGRVRFVAISVGPEDDSPGDLRRYAQRWGTGPGWVYLTGRKENTDWVVYKLGQYTEQFEDHSMLFLQGDVRNGRWKNVRGDAPPAPVSQMLDELLGPR